MTKVWYEIKKIFKKAEIDIKNCDLCRQSLKLLDKYPLKEGEAIVIYPVFNTWGTLVNVHIGRVLIENITETKIYKDLEE